MDRAYEVNPAAAAPPAPNPPLLGYPTETGTPTVPGAWWFYMITEEIRAVLVTAGIAPNAQAVNQLALAVTTLINDAITALGLPAWTTAATANILAERDASAILTAAGFNVSSDASLKEDIKPITGALARLALYRGVTFRRKDTGQVHAGLIADHFAAARPESVRKGADDLLGIDVMGANASNSATWLVQATQ